MIRECFDAGWEFALGEKDIFSREPLKMRAVHLPHDWSIELERRPDAPGGNANGYFQGGSATYRKAFTAPEAWRDKKVAVEFEGVYMNARVWLNGNLLCVRPYGYSSFHADLGPYLKLGQENRLEVIVNNAAQPNSRWYSGSGIYRHVWLMTGGAAHVAPWGVFVETTRLSDGLAQLCVHTRVENDTGRPVTARVRTRILAPDGAQVAAADSPLTLGAAETLEARQQMTVAAPALWSLEAPNLYTARSEIVLDEGTADTSQTRFGIRSISFDAAGGFRLNGQEVKLRGACIHHDNGPLGTASLDRAEERKVQLMKEAGFNAIRSSHNPASPALLDVCDRLGMLVMDEAFDCWRAKKTLHDYNLYFEDWWQRDLGDMILRDRNHPSIILWSIGNEIPERDGSSQGYAWSRRLAEYVRSLDGSRGVTSAICQIMPSDEAVSQLLANTQGEGESSGDQISQFFELMSTSDDWEKLTEEYAAPLDVVGYNYLPEKYEKDGRLFPDRVICGTESFPDQIAAVWKEVERLPHVIGDFTWTGWDYFGESGIGHVWYNGESGFMGEYPWHIAWCGDFDICGFRRPQSYFREVVWGLRAAPYIAVGKPEHYGKPAVFSKWGFSDVAASWSWPGFEGKHVQIEIYSPDEEVELLLNGRALGRRPAGKANGFTAKFDAVYEPGELTAVSYNGGKESARSTLKTCGAPCALRLRADRGSLSSAWGDLAYITCEVVDARGSRVPYADDRIHVEVTGAAELAGLGTGDPVSREGYTGPNRSAFGGRLLAIARTKGEAGTITVKASAPELGGAELTLRAE